MPEALLDFLIIMPVIVAVVAAALSWRRLGRPVLFLVTAVLSLLGIQAIVSPAVISIVLPSSSGLTRAAANTAFVHSVVSAAVLVVVVGCPLLRWLFLGLRRA